MVIEYKVFTPDEASDHLDRLVDLRLSFYREYPYLLELDEAVAREQMDVLTKVKGSLIIAALEDGQIVNCSVSAPFLVYRPGPAFDRFFETNSLKDYLYSAFTLSVPKARRVDVALKLNGMINDEQQARGFKGRLIMNIVRPADDPRAPKGYKPSGRFFRALGYEPLDLPAYSASYVDIGDSEPTAKSFEFYIKKT